MPGPALGANKRRNTMLHLAIVEDDAVMRRYLREKISETLSSSRSTAEYDLFEDGDSFLSFAADHYHFDAVFLDIEMPGTDGIGTARRFLRLQPESRIIFVSAREDLVYDTFAVRPFRFLPKSRLLQRLPEALEALVEETASSVSDRLIFSDSSGDMYSFSLRTVVYIEARNKDCRIVTTEGEREIRCRLTDIELKLPSGNFIKIHRSYIVNASYIYLIGRSSVTLTTGEDLPLSRNRVQEVRRAFLLFAGDN